MQIVWLQIVYMYSQFDCNYRVSILGGGDIPNWNTSKIMFRYGHINVCLVYLTRDYWERRYMITASFMVRLKNINIHTFGKHIL